MDFVVRLFLVKGHVVPLNVDKHLVSLEKYQRRARRVFNEDVSLFWIFAYHGSRGIEIKYRSMVIPIEAINALIFTVKNSHTFLKYNSIFG